MGKSRYTIKYPSAPHLMTCTVLHWLPVFIRPETVDIVLNGFRFIQQENLVIHAWVTLENHLRLIARSNDLRGDITRFKTHTAKELLGYLNQRNAKIPVHGPI